MFLKSRVSKTFCTVGVNSWNTNIQNGFVLFTYFFYCDTSLSYFFWFAFPRTIDSFKQAHFLLCEQRGENGWVERKKGRFWKFETSWDKQTAVTLNELSKIICDYIVLSTFSFFTCPLFPPSLVFLPQPAIFSLQLSLNDSGQSSENRWPSIIILRFAVGCIWPEKERSDKLATIDRF